jgi:hypothetical protein
MARPSGGYAREPGAVATVTRRIIVFPQAEVVLIASLTQNGAGFSLLLHNNSLLQTVIVHAVLGGCGPRRQPLNETDRHATWARRQLESVLAGGNDDSGIKCDRTTAALVHRLESGWQRQRRSGPVAPATESKFVVYFNSARFRTLFGLSVLCFSAHLYIRLVEFVIVGQ